MQQEGFPVSDPSPSPPADAQLPTDGSETWSDGNADAVTSVYQRPEPVSANGTYVAPVVPEIIDSAEFPPQPIRRTIAPSAFYRELLETLLLTLLIFWVVNTFTGRFRIEGQSMLPTLHESEYVLINKMAYYFDEPERGDIIVLHYPRDRSRDFIKRVIGLPGDTIELGDNRVVVNGVALDEPYIQAPASNSGSWTVPPGNYFVMGDNRNNSSDSRNWSFLPQSDIVGRAWVIYWPVAAVKRAPHFDHSYVPVP